ncbi:unnamed protein product [Schistocephalus solidus]|uniref:Uncharacterized protein n=1 Tax=Schistocephalus solidus TaxID=70667 RepID=A0A183S8A4_SCHSO|nr:unnamed protein product [Schistocephalus solidus]
MVPKHGTETGNAHGSYHVLVRTRLKVHLLSDPNAACEMLRFRQYPANIEIRSRFTIRADREGSDQCSSLEKSVYGAAEKIRRFTQRRRSDWTSERALQLSAQPSRARSRNDASFRQLRNTTTKSARNDRQKYWSEIATSIEQASNVGDTCKLYQIIRHVSGMPSTFSDFS